MMDQLYAPKGPFIFYLGGWAGGNKGCATQNKWPKKGGLCENFCQGRGGSRKNINFCFFKKEKKITVLIYRKTKKTIIA
jgi:hypothetical protein